MTYPSPPSYESYEWTKWPFYTKDLPLKIERMDEMAVLNKKPSPLRIGRMEEMAFLYDRPPLRIVGWTKWLF